MAISQRAINRGAAIFVPLFLLALSIYASWVVVSEVAGEQFFPGRAPKAKLQITNVRDKEC
jgi:hypothetical protein